MKQFETPKAVRVILAPKDILTASEETQTAAPTETSNKGDIILPPDTFEDG